MTKQITIPMSETEAVDSFTVSEQFVEQWNKNVDNVWEYEPSEQDLAEFEALVDSIYATLTHEQKKTLLNEALETYNGVQDFISGYEISAREQLSTCVMSSLGDYYQTVA